ncbi:MAG: hypothetical protein IJ769_04245 [Clostridia bacterium]|nr:hypothetical protein [Clostridia bacterium]
MYRRAYIAARRRLPYSTRAITQSRASVASSASVSTIVLLHIVVRQQGVHRGVQRRRQKVKQHPPLRVLTIWKQAYSFTFITSLRLFLAYKAVS